MSTAPPPDPPASSFVVPPAPRTVSIRTALRFVERWLILVVGTSTLALALFAVDSRLDRGTEAVAVARWWWRWMLLQHAACALPAIVATTVARRAVPARTAFWLATCLLSLAGAVWIGLNVALLARLAALPATVRVLLAFSIVASLLVVAASAVNHGGLRATRVALALAAPVALFVALDRGSISSRAGTVESAPRSSSVRAPARLLVLGLDGADWTYIDPMIERGELPNLRQLRDEGAWGTLETLQPTLSPLIWTTMVTGREPEEHGVFQIQVLRPRGLEVGTRATAPEVRGLGVAQLRSLLLANGQLVRSPVTSAERRVPALWNIATQYSRPLAVTSWWATWPTEPILGRMVSDRVFYDRASAQGSNETPTQKLTFPESLTPLLRRLTVRPDDISFERARQFLDVSRAEYEEMLALPYRHHDVRSEFRLYLSMFDSDLAFARALLRLDRDRGQTPMNLMALFRIVDHASHCCLKYSPLVGDPIDSSPADRERFGRFTEEAYRTLDAAVGELRAGFGGGNLLIVSDHGFRLETRSEKTARYAHASGPPGIWIGWGPSFRQGRFDGLTVYDVMPLLLYLNGLPLDRSARGTLHSEILDAEMLRSYPPDSVANFGFVPLPERRAGAWKGDQEILEELKALGYL